MVNELPGQEPFEFFHHKGRSIIGVEDVRGTILGYDTVDACTRDWADFDYMWKRNGYLLSKLAISQ